MRLFIATLSTETNTFCTMPTAMSGFEEYFLRHGTATLEPPNLMTEALHVWRHRAEALNWTVTESLAAIAEPAGRTTAACYAALRDELLTDLRKSGGADIILLQLHGAMVAEGVDDCEGDIIAHMRRLCPDAVIGVALDLHCHLTDQMMRESDLLISFKEYPHDDASARAEELFDLAHDTAKGEITPVMAAFDCRMVNLYLTKTHAMRQVIDGMQAAEAEPGILSVSLIHGFPWADVPDVGAKMLVVADGNPDLAQEKATHLGRDFVNRRHEVTGSYASIDAALDMAANCAAGGRVVLADMGDNSGGGAPGDATFLLRALLDRGLHNVASGIYWDPTALRICQDAGEGAALRLRIGGKTSTASGQPVDLDVKVMKIASGLGQHLGPGLEPLGTLAWLRAAGDLDLLIGSIRTQVYHPEAFEQLGIDLSQKSVVVVKSLFHFFTPFQKIASKVVQVATPGGTSPDFRSMSYTRRDAQFWPRIEDPFASDHLTQPVTSDV